MWGTKKLPFPLTIRCSISSFTGYFGDLLCHITTSINKSKIASTIRQKGNFHQVHLCTVDFHFTIIRLFLGGSTDPWEQDLGHTAGCSKSGEAEDFASTSTLLVLDGNGDIQACAQSNPGVVVDSSVNMLSPCAAAVKKANSILALTRTGTENTGCYHTTLIQIYGETTLQFCVGS